MAYKINSNCTACGSCADTCPHDAIVAGDIYKIQADDCIDCGACADVCPSDAINADSLFRLHNRKDT